MTLSSPTIEAYAQIKSGIPAETTPWQFIENTLDTVTAISTSQLAMAIGVRQPDPISGQFYRLSRKLLDQISVYYGDEINNFTPGTQEQVKKLVNAVPGQLDREYVGEVVDTAGIHDLDQPALTLMQTIGFRFFVDFVNARVEAMPQDQITWTPTQVRSLAASETITYPPEYRARSLAKLEISLANEKDLTPKEQQAATVAEYLANYLWQMAKVCQYASEVSEGGTSTRLSQSDFASFDDMITTIYQEHQGKRKNDLEALLLTAFKLFQDAAEYMPNPLL